MFRFIPRECRQKALRRDTVNGELLSRTLDSCEVDDLPLNLCRRRFHEVRSLSPDHRSTQEANLGSNAKLWHVELRCKKKGKYALSYRHSESCALHSRYTKEK